MTKEPNMRGHVNRLWLGAVLVALSGWSGVAMAAGPITGTVPVDRKGG